MRRVEGVNEVRGESGGLALHGDGEIVGFFSDVHALQQGLHLRVCPRKNGSERASERARGGASAAASATPTRVRAIKITATMLTKRSKNDKKKGEKNSADNVVEALGGAGGGGMAAHQHH